MKYNYKTYFHIEGREGTRYFMNFYVEADSNKEAVVIGKQRWKEQVEKTDRLKKAYIVKTTCRAVETKLKQRKLTPIQKALTELNRYILEDINK